MAFVPSPFYLLSVFTPSQHGLGVALLAYAMMEREPPKASYQYWLKQFDKLKPAPNFQRANHLVDTHRILSDISNGSGLIYISSISTLYNSDDCVSKVENRQNHL